MFMGALVGGGEVAEPIRPGKGAADTERVLVRGRLQAVVGKEP